MVEPNLRMNYIIILDVLVQLHNEHPETPFIPKDLVLQKISTIPDNKKKILNLNWKEAGFKGVLHRLQELKYIESQVIIDKGLRKTIKISEKGRKLLDDIDFVRKFIKSSVF